MSFLFAQFSQLYSCCNKIYNLQWRDRYLWGCGSKYLFSLLSAWIFVYFLWREFSCWSTEPRYIALACNFRKIMNSANSLGSKKMRCINWFNCILSARNYSVTSSLLFCVCYLNNAGRLAKTTLEKFHVNFAWYESSRWIKLKLPPDWSGHISDYSLPASWPQLPALWRVRVKKYHFFITTYKTHIGKPVSSGPQSKRTHWIIRIIW